MKVEPIVGRYAHIDNCRIYFEEAGRGFSSLLAHRRLGRPVARGAERRRDHAALPRHRVRHAVARQVIAARRVAKRGLPADDGVIHGALWAWCALGLERPVVMGCSIGGRIVLELALKHAREPGALIGLQSGAYVERYYDASWLDHPEVRRTRLRRGGLRAHVAAQPGEGALGDGVALHAGWPGVFTGDLFFYQVDGDIRDRIGAIDTSACPLYLLTGEYDYSASPRDTEAVVARVKGARMTVMKGLGHFPMSENPEAFLGYLRPVLKEIRT